MGLTRDEARAILGLGESFNQRDLIRARRRALVVNHPDHGGSTDALMFVEAAFRALAMAGAAPRFGGESVRVRRGSDRPSFTLDVLPVDAFEILILAASELGEIGDDDPPYRLEVRLQDPAETWMTFEIVPDAGGSTVSFSLEGPTSVDVEAIRDVWITTINLLGTN